MEHFDFPHGTVTGMNLKGCVGLRPTETDGAGLIFLRRNGALDTIMLPRVY